MASPTYLLLPATYDAHFATPSPRKSLTALVNASCFTCSGVRTTRGCFGRVRSLSLKLQ